ncbi:MAG: efflux RND transporter periplasmic adaptor subunit [Bacteroidetes bacterium]|nr:efflux RND transporter periplasmic adaptor subunit [Bacteroidota bacterium]MBS1609576.1 efflux RND transporter periplasmic adaptor subunit [Bacteroidota bacterium]
MHSHITFLRKTLFAGAGLSALFYITSCKGKVQGDPDPKKQVCITDSLAKIIRIDTAGIANIDDEVKLSGEISFNDNKVVKVYPFSSGKVREVKVSLGDKVAKGQVLAVIQSADVAGNYSDLSSANNDISIAKRQMDNTESLYKNGIASEKEYSEAKENYQKALSAGNKLQQQININGGGHTSANGTYVITAPMNGYVVEKKISQGAFIRNDNSDNLFTIGDISEVWVWANVYETDISKVKEGYKAKVTTLAYPDSTFTAVVDKVNQILDPETKVMKVRIRIPNAGKQLKPEMFANILVQNREGKKSVMVPSTAIVSDYGKNYVIIYHDKCNLELKQVEILKTVEGKTYISSGLKGGEQLISENQVLLFNALKD